MSAADSFALVEDADPALIYLIFTWLRKRYADHDNSDAVIGRLVAISSRGSVAKKMKEGQARPTRSPSGSRRTTPIARSKRRSSSS